MLKAQQLKMPDQLKDQNVMFQNVLRVNFWSFQPNNASFAQEAHSKINYNKQLVNHATRITQQQTLELHMKVSVTRLINVQLDKTTVLGTLFVLIFRTIMIYQHSSASVRVDSEATVLIAQVCQQLFELNIYFFDLDACSNFCLNDGVCKKNQIGIVECQCKENFSGERCEIRFQPRTQKIAFITAGIGGVVFLLIIIVIVIWMIGYRYNKSDRVSGKHFNSLRIFMFN